MPAALVNTAEVHDFTNTFTASMSLPATSLTAGNLITVSFTTFHFFGSAPTGVVTDTAGNTYTLAVRQVESVNGWFSAQIWYCENALGHASNVVTVTYSASSNNHTIISAQYSGIATTSVLDTTTGNESGSTATTSYTSPPYTTSNASALILAMFFQRSTFSSTFTAGSGFTIQNYSQYTLIEDSVVSSIQTGATVSATSSNSGPWINVVVAFKATVPAASGACTEAANTCDGTGIITGLAAGIGFCVEAANTCDGQAFIGAFIKGTQGQQGAVYPNGIYAPRATGRQAHMGGVYGIRGSYVASPKGTQGHKGGVYGIHVTGVVHASGTQGQGGGVLMPIDAVDPNCITAPETPLSTITDANDSWSY